MSPSLARRLRLVLLCTLLFAGAAAQIVANAENNSECDAEHTLTLGPDDDPVSTDEMTLALALVKPLAKVLVESGWKPKPDELDVKKVKTTLVYARQKKVRLDSEGFRSLFMIVGRYLLNAKGSEGRLRPMAELLKTTEANVHVLVTFFSQLDTLYMTDESNDLWPYFLREGDKPADFLLRALEKQNVPDHTMEFIKKNFLPLLRQRARMAKLSVDESGNQIELRSPVGVYKVNLRQGLKSRPLVASLDIHSTTRWGRTNDQTIRSIVEIDLEDEFAQSYLRTMIRADPFLHPHMIPPTLERYPIPSLLSPMQEKVVTDLKAEDEISEKEKIASGETGPTPIAFQVTTGAGKTPIGAAFIHDLIFERWDERRPRIWFVVESMSILEQTGVTFPRDLGIDSAKVHMMAGPAGVKIIQSGYRETRFTTGASVLPNDDVELVLISRSTLHKNLPWFIGQLKRENAKKPALRRPQVLFVDEAHHLEAEDGQYDGILAAAEKYMRHEDRLIGASATFGSKLLNILVDKFKGHVVGNHLERWQLAQLQAGENLDRLALYQFLNATVDGYVNPIDDTSFTLVQGQATAEKLRERLNANLVADRELYDTVATTIRGMRHHDSLDRWMFFDVKKSRAEDGTKYLQKKFGEASANYMHSDLEPDEAADRLNWFRDAGPHRATRHHHKSLVVVGQAIEGTDAKGTNGVAAMRNLGGDRIVQQILGRGARLEAFKKSIKVADPAGRITRYLEQAGELWTQVRDRLEDLNVEIWRGKAPPLKVPPSKTEIEAQRQAMLKALEVMTGPNGAARIFAWNPDTGRSGPVDLRARFEQWYARFPEALQTRYAPSVAKIAWPPNKVDLDANLGGGATMAVRSALFLLAMMYNELPLERRLGLGKIAKDSIYTRASMSPLFFVLGGGSFDVRPSSKYLLRTWDYAEQVEWRMRLGLGQFFRGNSEQAKMLSQFVDFPAHRLLRMLPQLVAKRPHLATKTANRLLALGAEAMAHADQTGEGAQPIATFYLAQLINHWSGLDPIGRVKAWDLNVAFDLPTNPDLDPPSMSGFWTAFGVLDTVLAEQAALRAAETEAATSSPTGD